MDTKDGDVLEERNLHEEDAAASQPMVFQVRIKGHLGPEWKDWFEGATIVLEEGGEALLTAEVVDQAALHGLLKKVFGLGIPLIAVNRLDY